jgi:hypothetical protein
VGPSDRVTIARDIHFRQFDDEVIVLDLGKGDYFSLDEVGARVWLGLASGLTPKDVAISLSGDYDVSEQRLLEDFLELIEELRQAGLVHIEGER